MCGGRGDEFEVSHLIKPAERGKKIAVQRIPLFQECSVKFRVKFWEVTQLRVLRETDGFILGHRNSIDEVDPCSTLEQGIVEHLSEGGRNRKRETPGDFGSAPIRHRAEQG